MKFFFMQAAAWARSIAALAVLTLLVGGCTVRFISDYDEVTDRAATQLHGRIEAFLSRMEATAGTPAGSYAANTGFYADTAGELQALLTRSKSIPQNELTTKQFELLLDSVEQMRALHEQRGERGLASGQVKSLRSGFETQFSAITKLETAKKREG